VKFNFRTSLAMSLAAISTGFGTCASGATDNPFVGDWKLNRSKSRLVDEMKVESLAANKYSFDFQGNGVVETIVIDGTPQSRPTGRHPVWTMCTSGREADPVSPVCGSARARR
jgi:hypothetical protein